MDNKKTGIFLTVFFMVLGVAFLSYYFYAYKDVKRNVLPIYGNNESHHIDTFSFINQDGKTITNADIAGKVCVVSYFFATCRGICPKMNENLTKVYQAFKSSKDVIILSHTVDPLKDTVPALKAYSLRFDAQPEHWMFLTGSKQKLYDMARFSYLISADDDTSGVSIDKDFIHDKHYSLVDRHGRIRGFYDGLNVASVDKLIADIKELLKED